MELYNFELSDGKMFGPRRPVCLLYMGFLMKALLTGRWISLPDSDQMTGDVRHPLKVWEVEV